MALHLADADTFSGFDGIQPSLLVGFHVAAFQPGPP
jgi:hypothetical protein